MGIVKRYERNPILYPPNSIKAKALFNPAATLYKGEIWLFPRVILEEDYEDYRSRIYSYRSKDGKTFTKVAELIKPSENYDKGACEDPRATLFEDGKIYISYTAVDAPVRPGRYGPPQAALAIVKDPHDPSSVEKLGTISFPGVEGKGATLFPKKINGKIYVLQRPKFPFPQKPSIWIASYKDMESLLKKEVEELTLLLQPKHFFENAPYIQPSHIGPGAPPIETNYGWLCISHSAGYDLSGVRMYFLNAFLLDLDKPTKVIGVTKKPLLYPEEWYEVKGDVDNVIYATGAILMNEEVYIYAGTADKYVALYTAKLKDLMKELYKPPIETS